MSSNVAGRASTGHQRTSRDSALTSLSGDFFGAAFGGSSGQSKTSLTKSSAGAV